MVVDRWGSGQRISMVAARCVASYDSLSPLAALHHLTNFALHQIALQGADVADVELAVQVIGFMKEGASQEFLARLLVELAVHILGADGDLARARDGIS